MFMMVLNIRYFPETILIFSLILCSYNFRWTVSAIEAIEQENEISTNVNTAVPTIPESTEKMVVCYFASWAANRDGNWTFLPEDIDPHLCTHIIYAFALLNNFTLTMESAYSATDIGQNLFERVVDLKEKNPQLKVMIALGGWVDSEGSKYSRLVEDSKSRENFTKDAIEFLNTYKFDGLDIDWEYPVCWQADCAAGKQEDRDNFSTFLQELRKAFDELNTPFLLSASISASRYILGNAYDIKEVAKSLDFINVMSYNLHGSYENFAGHHSQLYPRTEDPNDLVNVDSTMKYLVENGVPLKKLILGIPFYGNSFTLEDPTNHGIGAPTRGAGRRGLYTKSPGTLAYFEICHLIKNDGWTVERDSEAGPYAYKGDQWVSYDDPKSAHEKAKYVETNGYGGVMVWDITMDDFRGSCHGQKYPMLKSCNFLPQHEDKSTVTSKGNDTESGESSKSEKEDSHSGAEAVVIDSIITILGFVLLSTNSIR